MRIITGLLCCVSHQSNKHDFHPNQDYYHPMSYHSEHQLETDRTSSESVSEKSHPINGCRLWIRRFFSFRTNNKSTVRSDSKNRYMSCIAIEVLMHLIPFSDHKPNRNLNLSELLSRYQDISFDIDLMITNLLSIIIIRFDDN